MTDQNNTTTEAELRKQIRLLELAEEGAKEAFGAVVQQKRDLEAKVEHLQKLLDGAYASIRRLSARGGYQPIGTNSQTQPPPSRL